jgi:hypothetical protein
MVPFTLKVPVSSDVVFPAGALCMGLVAATDFTRRGSADEQARDKDTGVRVWVVTVADLEQPDGEERFARSVEMKVRIVSDHRPVVPPALVAGFPPLVEFEGLTLTPFVDQARCGPAKVDRCRARLAFSLRASGMRAFAGGSGRDG